MRHAAQDNRTHPWSPLGAVATTAGGSADEAGASASSRDATRDNARRERGGGEGIDRPGERDLKERRFQQPLIKLAHE